MNNNEVVKILNGLIETCMERQDGFRAAAEDIPNSEVRRLFNIFSQQRAQFVTELQAEVRRLGGSPVDRRAETRASARVMFSFKSSRSTTEIADGTVILEECQQAEEGAVNSYQEALKADMPLDVQYVVKRQYMDIKDAFDRMRILQRAA